MATLPLDLRRFASQKQSQLAKEEEQEKGSLYVNRSETKCGLSATTSSKRSIKRCCSLCFIEKCKRKIEEDLAVKWTSDFRAKLNFLKWIIHSVEPKLKFKKIFLKEFFNSFFSKELNSINRIFNEIH